MVKIVIILYFIFNVYVLDISLYANQLDKLSEDLRKVYEDSRGNSELLPIYVEMKKQYPPADLYNKVKDLRKDQRRIITVETLKKFSIDTQQNLRITLKELEDANEISAVQYLWITNVIGMKATRESILKLNNHPDISKIHYDPLTHVLDYDEITDKNNNDNNMNRRNNERATSRQRRNVSYNVELVNAVDVWDLGFKGEGVLVAVLDTGVNYNHLDIRDQMWEHNDYPNYGFNFSSETDTLLTMDGHGHGTHCAGTVAGNGVSGLITGMAPESRIMSLKVLTDSGTGNHRWLWNGMQFAIEHGADIMSISLGWVNVTDAARAIFRDVATNVLAAGVIVSKSAGNRANQQNLYPVPHNLTVPGDCPPPWLSPDQVLIGGISSIVSVGATDSTDTIANFSSLGPTTWQIEDVYEDYPYDPEMGLLKPDISAPGVSVFSLVHNDSTGYTSKSGTSMAAPGVAGIMALMVSRNPHLLPEDISRIIEENAYQITETKSTVYGSGRIDALSSVEASAYIAVDEILFSFDDGSLPEYGETVQIGITLENFGIEDAEEVEGILSSDDEYIDIIEDTAEFGEIEEGTSVTIENAYTVTIADNTPHNHSIIFSLEIILDEETSWTNTFAMKVSAPDLITLNPYIHDIEPGGNNNGYIDPGEDIVLYLPLKNAGGSMSPPINVSVSSNSPLVEISGIAIDEFGSLWDGESIYPAIMMNISDDADYGDLLEFEYLFESGNYIFEGQFNTFVGRTIPVQLGSGETESMSRTPSPINVFYQTIRTQAIYTVEELREAGAYGMLPITSLGYYVTSSPEYSLPNFIIRMKHTTANDAARHDDGPFETVFEAELYSPTAGGWDMLALQTPFYWNGVDNIIVDTAFSPAENWDSSGQLRVYEFADGFRYSVADTLDQTDQPTQEVDSLKPQLLTMFDSVPGGDYDRPHSLTAGTSGLQVHLTWKEPGAGRSSANSSDRLGRKQEDRSRVASNHNMTRNPDGYNIYRNGLRINQDLVLDTEYFDEEYDSLEMCFYYVTAVYNNIESPASNVVDFQFTVATPEIIPDAKIQYKPFELSISCDTPGATIYYTLDESEPTSESILYEDPFKVDTDITVKARAFKEEWIDSDIISIKYYVLYKPSDLTASGGLDSVHLSWEPAQQPRSYVGRSRANSSKRAGATISPRNSRYSGERLGGNVSVDHRSLIGYNVYRSVLADSFIVINAEPVTEVEYIDDRLPPTGLLTYYVTAVYDAGESLPTEKVSIQRTLARPVLSPEPGVYEDPIEVIMTASTRGAVIYYTLDENDPDDTSLIYTDGEPVKIDQTTTIKAITVKDGWLESEITEAFYEFPTNIDDREEPMIYVTELLSAYPNPFNPETVIEFTLKETDRVTIDIFNIAGRRVKTLVNDDMEPGHYRLIWRGNDSMGQKMSSGIYFYRMTTSDYDKVRKLLMLK